MIYSINFSGTSGGAEICGVIPPGIYDLMEDSDGRFRSCVPSQRISQISGLSIEGGFPCAAMVHCPEEPCVSCLELYIRGEDWILTDGIYEWTCNTINWNPVGTNRMFLTAGCDICQDKPYEVLIVGSPDNLAMEDWSWPALPPLPVDFKFGDGCICGFTVTANLDWPNNGFPDLDLYVKNVNNGGICYFGATTSGGLTLNHDAWPVCNGSAPAPPEIITGNFSASTTFSVWWNQFSTCATQTAPSLANFVITNTNTCTLSISIDGAAPVSLTNGNSLMTSITGNFAGYGTGTQTGFLGGKFFAISCPGGSSSSSNSCTREPCSVIVNLSGPCGLELSGGIVYSIGDQIINVDFTDDCECVEEILINGLPLPYQASDGEDLFVSLVLNDQCFYLSQDDPVCVLPMFGISGQKGSKIRMKLLPENLTKYLLSRRRAKVAAGK